MKKRVIAGLVAGCFGMAHADVSEIFLYPEPDFSHGIAHFNYQGSEARAYAFVFDKGVEADRILYAYPSEHTIEKLQDGLVKLSFAATNTYTYLQKLTPNDFVISRENGALNILVTGGECMRSADCVIEENILSIMIPQGYEVKGHKALGPDLKELTDVQWEQKGDIYTLVARNVKGAYMVLQVEKSAVGGAGSVTLNNGSLFEKGEVKLSVHGKKRLESFAREYKQNGGKKVVIEGHTDNIPLHRLKALYSTNRILSKARARCVGEYLKRLGIESAEIIGYGETKPIASNETEAGRAKNGRIELLLKP